MFRNPAALALVSLSLAFTGCKTVSKTQNRVETVAADLLVSPDQERELGKKVAAEVLKENKLLENPEVTNYVASIGRKLVRSSAKSPFNMTFLVIDDPKTINAFAIPGGRIYVYTGLIKAAKSEAELAAVLAHEVAHVTNRHLAKRLVKAYGLQALAAAALGENPGVLSQIVSGIAIQGTLLKNSREAERESDIDGVVALSKAGYQPQAMVSFFRTLMAQEGKVPKVFGFISDHPLTAERVQYLQQEIRQRRLTGSRTGEAELQAIQKLIP